jgi:hypothetical protein
MPMPDTVLPLEALWRAGGRYDGICRWFPKKFALDGHDHATQFRIR